MKDSIVVVCSSSRAFFPHCTAMILSLIKSNQNNNIVIYVLHYNLIIKEINILSQISKNYNIEIKALKINIELFQNAPVGIYNISTYCRIAIPLVLPDNINKALYLDCDIIINGDVKQLWETYLGDTIAGAAVKEVPIYNIEHCERLSIPKELGYYNTGVFLFNISYWRTYGISNKIIKFINQNPNLIKLCDQDAINIVLSDKLIELPYIYNVLPFFYQPRIALKYFESNKLKEIQRKATIIHFQSIKPWEKNDCPYFIKKNYAKNIREIWGINFLWLIKFTNGVIFSFLKSRTKETLHFLKIIKYNERYFRI